MKNFSVGVLIGLSAGLLTIDAAVADPFNDRGLDWITTVKPSQQARPAERFAANPLERQEAGAGGDWVANITPDRRLPPRSSVECMGQIGPGFIERDNTQPC